MWDLDFISESDFRTHVRNTIEEYKRTLRSSISLEQFNKNIIDPVKFAFDKALYGLSWRELINKEILRQKDKTINNSIGYFHQKIFQYIHRDGCTIIVPENGSSAFSNKGGQSGWDVAFGDMYLKELGEAVKDQKDFMILEIKEKGLTLMPLKVYWNNSNVKIEVGLARGKKLYDKRADIAKKDQKREAERDFKIKNLK